VKPSIRRWLLTAIGFAASGVWATDMVYVPVNPAFGGSPLHGPNLLATAQATNRHRERPHAGLSLAGGLSGQSTLQQFNDILQRSILSRIATATASGIVGADGKLTPGAIETRDFQIEIVDLGGGLLQIKTTDKANGSSTSFQISQ
jgi:curli production assembly/transport component CsgF